MSLRVLFIQYLRLTELEGEVCMYLRWRLKYTTKQKGKEKENSKRGKKAELGIVDWLDVCADAYCTSGM